MNARSLLPRCVGAKFFGKFGSNIYRIERGGIKKFIGLFFDGGNYLFITVSEVRADPTARKIQISPSVHINKVTTSSQS